MFITHANGTSYANVWVGAEVVIDSQKSDFDGLREGMPIQLITSGKKIVRVVVQSVGSAK